MKITYSDARKYILTTEDDTFLGSLKYENWTYSKAEITTQFSEFFHIFTPDYKWKKGHYDFKIEVNPDFADSIDEGLVLVSTHAVLYLIMMMAAGA